MAGRRDPDGAGICARPHLLTRLAPSCVQQRFSGRARLEQHQGRFGGLGGDFFGQCQPRGPLAEHTPHRALFGFGALQLLWSFINRLVLWGKF